MNQIWIEFHISVLILLTVLSFHLLQFFHFLNSHISLPFISAVMSLLAHVLTVCAGEHAIAGTHNAFAAVFMNHCCLVWLLALTITCAAYQTARASRAKFISQQNLSVG